MLFALGAFDRMRGLRHKTVSTLRSARCVRSCATPRGHRCRSKYSDRLLEHFALQACVHRLLEKQLKILQIFFVVFLKIIILYI